ncbi:hypothetical protein FUAX_03200 [Fulvitalea axinellae]|uniref:Uncharacterized protein n=1 Tax=Fulvitalea axinellae TaxID=1182444 RepID=A0AAU9CDM9_9BACT|nr:hypothetical protein FUAX_03200 [Fulvitalea axinellae]
MRKLKHVFLATFAMWALPAVGQHVNVDQMLVTGVENTNTYFEHYMRPAAKLFGFAPGNAWVNSAKAKKPLEWKIRVIGNVTFMPSKLMTFDFVESQYEALTANNLPNNEAPTIFGRSQWEGTTPTYSYSTTFPNAGNPVEDRGTVNVPTGFDPKRAFGSRIMPIGLIQAEVGLLQSLEVKVRFSPWIGEDEWRTYTWGVGFLHNFTEIEPLRGKAPLDVSAFLGFSYTRNEWALEESPLTANGPRHYAGTKSSNVTFQIVGSKTWNILTLYLLADYSFFFADAELYGEYTHEINPNFILTYRNPAKADYRGGSFGFAGGATLDFGYVSIDAGYTLSRYSNFNVGIGVGLPR